MVEWKKKTTKHREMGFSLPRGCNAWLAWQPLRRYSILGRRKTTTTRCSICRDDHGLFNETTNNKSNKHPRGTRKERHVVALTVY